MILLVCHDIIKITNTYHIAIQAPVSFQLFCGVPAREHGYYVKSSQAQVEPLYFLYAAMATSSTHGIPSVMSHAPYFRLRTILDCGSKRSHLLKVPRV